MTDTESTGLKTTKLPAQDEMLRRLKTVVDDEHNLSKFYELVLAAAGKKLAGVGVVRVLYLAFDGYEQQAGSMVAQVLKLQVKQFVTVLVDDKEIRAEALQFIDEVETGVANARAARPIPTRPELTDDNKALHMRCVKRMVGIYDELVTDQSEARPDSANPFYNQTASGFFLQFCGGLSSVWTPWGQWAFADVNASNSEVVAFMARLTVCEEIPETHSKQGVHGPVYAVLAIDGEELPAPVRLADQRQYFEYEAAKAEWLRLFETN